MSARDIGQLLRLSLAASAPADALAGVVLGHAGWPPGATVWLLPIGSACVFHGGLALNDWADREHDGRTRPERPIPSGAVSAHTALALGLGLLAAGVTLGFLAGSAAGWLLGSVAALALFYDVKGRGPWLGPTLLGLCRAGNLAAGLALGLSFGSSASGSGYSLLFLLVPAAYGLYVFLVSRLGRLEDGEDDLGSARMSPGRLVTALAVVLISVSLLPLPVLRPLHEVIPARLVALGLTASAAVGLLRRVRREPIVEARQIPPVMGMALRRLLIFSAAVALLPGAPVGWLVCAGILCGYPLSHALRRAFPPS